MNKVGPIIIIEDDDEDAEIFQTVYSELEYDNELILFHDAPSALHYIKQEEIKPFLIISDIYMPEMTGLELRALIHNDSALRAKCTPYIFFTSGEASFQVITTAYHLSVQGFFQKPGNLTEFKLLIKHIIEYWKMGIIPGGYKI